MPAGMMLKNHHSVIFIAGNSKSVVEVVLHQLQDDFDKVIPCVSDSQVEIVNEMRRSYADVLILAYETLELAATVSDRLYAAHQKTPLKPYRVLALCSKSDVKHAYSYYGERKFNDYVVYWPLTYDPYRLVLSVHQAIDDLKYNQNAKQLLREIAELKTELARVTAAYERCRNDIHAEGDGLQGAMEQQLEQLSRQLAQYEQPPSASAPGQIGQMKATMDSLYLEIRQSLEMFRDLRRTALNPRPPAAPVAPSGTTLIMPAPNANTDVIARQKKTVLVVDDDTFQRNVLKKLLRSEKFDVEMAENGVQALEMLQQSQPDLVLLDLLMPGMNGLEVMQRIRQHPTLSQVPVVVISGEHEKETVIECLKLGASGYVVKPYTRKTLLEKIDKALLR